jgi:hypothetical protein
MHVKYQIFEAYYKIEPKTFWKLTNFYGDGNAAKFICQTIVESFKEIG